MEISALDEPEVKAQLFVKRDNTEHSGLPGEALEKRRKIEWMH